MLNKYLQVALKLLNLHLIIQVALKFLNLHLTIYAEWFRIDALPGSAVFWDKMAAAEILGFNF